MFNEIREALKNQTIIIQNNNKEHHDNTKKEIIETTTLAIIITISVALTLMLLKKIFKHFCTFNEKENNINLDNLSMHTIRRDAPIEFGIESADMSNHPMIKRYQKYID